MRFTALFLLLAICGPKAFSQEADHVNGRRFEKRVEYNTYSGIIVMDDDGNRYPSYIVNGKSRLEKVFFGDFNAPVEYVFEPTYQNRAIASAIRLVKGPSSDVPYILEIKWITNWREAYDALGEKYPRLKIYAADPKEEQERVIRQNEEIYKRINEERFDLFETETLSFPVRDLCGMLYDKMVALIDTFKAEGGAAIGADGDTVTFRCVVGDELWTLTIHEPQKRALQMSNLCRQIIEDAQSGKEFDERKYVRMLEPIEF